MGSKPKKQKQASTPVAPIAPIMALTDETAGTLSPNRRRASGAQPGFQPVLTGDLGAASTTFKPVLGT